MARGSSTPHALILYFQRHFDFNPNEDGDPNDVLMRLFSALQEETASNLVKEAIDSMGLKYYEKRTCSTCGFIAASAPSSSSIIYVTPEADLVRSVNKWLHGHEDEALYCSRCRGTRNFITLKRITKLPEYLILCVNRVKFGPLGMTKDTTKVKPVMSMTISGFKQSHEFELGGTIVHLGDTPNTGHYIYLERAGENFVQYDDVKVSHCGSAEKYECGLVLLVYKNRHTQAAGKVETAQLLAFHNDHRSYVGHPKVIYIVLHFIFNET